MQSAERLADDLLGLVQHRVPLGNGNPYKPRLRGDRTTRHPLDYLPSQLPPSPTAHEYLSFPLLLSPPNEGS